MQDILYAFRVLRKSPGFTLVALVTLMLGIGANAVVFGVLNAVLLEPLAVKDPQSLYQLRHKKWATGRLLTTSYPAFEDFRQRNAVFSGMAGVYGYSGAALRWGNAVVHASGDEVTGNYFDMLGVQPAAGRFFHEANENGPGSAPYVVLSDAFWRKAFQSDPAIVGATVEMNRRPFTVVGVAPAEFHGLERFVWPDYWIPMVNEAQVDGGDRLHSRTSVSVTVIARLKQGVTAAQAAENLNAIAGQLAREYPRSDDGEPLRLIHPGLYGDEGDVIRGFLWSVTALALLVLLAACANLATMFAARASDRTRELALRIALGASRLQLVRQLLTEAVVVSLMGGAAGLLGAGLLLGALNRWHPSYGGHVAVSMDWRVYAAGLALTLGSALLFGLGPAWRAWGNSSPIRGIAPLRRFAMRDLLLAVQIGICTLLVTASLVAVRGMQRQLAVPLGFHPEGAMLVEPDLSGAGPVSSQTILEAIRGVPGVTATGAISRTPFTGGMHGVPIFRPGITEFTLNNSALASYVFSMSPGYLDAAGTRLLRGRDFSWHDTAATAPVAIVNEMFARRMWGEAQALGQRFLVGGKLTEVVGVTETGKYHDLREEPQAVAYVPFLQNELFLKNDPSDAVYVVRSPRSTGEMAAAIERSLRGILPNAPVSVESWTGALESELFPARAATVALGTMGLLAAMLAVTGIFGMAAYSVSRRMKELGIRVALGAKKAQVMRAAVGRPIALLGVGAALGLMAGIVAGPLLGRIVYRADPSDPAVIGGAVLTMMLLGIVASAFPAARALAVDPSKLMREE